MHVIQLSIPIFELNELSSKARQKAISEHRDFLLGIESDSDAVESIEINKYLFYVDGEVAPVTTYTGAHPESGKREFSYKGVTMEF